jgi:hypothetical protein
LRIRVNHREAAYILERAMKKREKESVQAMEEP